MAKKSPKETSIPLVIALVFFVLTTIAFGVMWYMQYSDQQAKDDAVAKAKKDVTAAAGEAADAQLEARILRIYLGIDEEKDKDSVASETKEMVKVASKVKKINDGLLKALAVDDYSKVSPDDLKTWPIDEKGQAANAKEVKGILPIVGDAVAKRNTAIDEAAKERDLYKTAVADIGKAIKELKNSTKDFTDKAAAMPKDFKEKLDAIVKRFDDRTEKYTQNESKAREENVKVVDEKQAVDRKFGKLKTEYADAVDQNHKLNKELEKRKDTLQFEEPQGKIVRRLPDGVVEINLGSDALVRPGLTFMVLPQDYPEKGRQSRIRGFRIPDAKGDYKTVERFVEKGGLEVIEVIGPKLSRCRITSETEPIRDAIGTGDLLYNVAWRKGVTDHIALIGIFDTNGDGSDDIENVVKDLFKMGIPVDAYFDLKSRTWKGQIDTQTRYIIRGALPSATGSNDPRREDKSKLYSAIDKAIEGAQLKGGAVPIDYRDFFQRMGYRVKVDVSPERINQAATPYLQGVTSVESESK